MKTVKFSRHAQENMAWRGASESEVIEAIRTTPWQSAELDRLECRKDFPFNKDWNGRVYAFKQVRPIFVEEPTAIVVVTVYVYYIL